MEQLEGATLHELLQKEGRLPVDRALYMLLQVARALDYAHKQGVVHRAVKPNNIVITSEELVKVTDFGIARATNDLLRTPKGVLFGSPAYLSLEQVLGELVDYRTDIFSLGVTAYESLTGRHPFKAPTAAAVMHRIATDEPDPAPELPRYAEMVLHRALAKKPDERPLSALAMVEELTSAYCSAAVISPEARITLPSPHGRKERTQMSTHFAFSGSRRSLRSLWWTSIVILVLAVGGFIAWRVLSPPREQFGVRIVDVGQSPPTTLTVATNYVLNDFELTPGSWQAESAGLKLEGARGGASQAAYWLKISGVQLEAGERAAISCLPETRDWSRFGSIISLHVLVPGTAPPTYARR